MWNRWTCWLAAVLLISGCSQGTLTRVVRTDGTTVVGELVAARPEAVVVKIADGSSVTIPRSMITSIETAAANAAAPSASASASTGKTASGGGPGAPGVREVTAPSGTLLELSLNTPIGSDTSAIDDKVDAVLRAPLVVNGTQVLGAGTAAHGIVTEATPATKAAGRGRLSVRFETIQLGQKSLPIQASPVRWEASPSTAGGGSTASRDEPPPRNLWGRLVRKTKKGLRIGDEDRGRGGAGAGAGTSADVRFAAGAVVRIRLEQAARIAP
jgi:hypothetical protein